MIYLDYAVCENGSAEQHTAAKKLLSELICNTFEIKNADRLIRVAKGGKPYIENAGFDFSDAHTEGAVAVAACGNGKGSRGLIISGKQASKIGVDIECQNRVIKNESIRRIANKLFSETEREYLDIKTEGYKTRFLELWTKKEAIVKATGEGLAGISGANTALFSGVFLETYRVTVESGEYIISVAAM